MMFAEMGHNSLCTLAITSKWTTGFKVTLMEGKYPTSRDAKTTKKPASCLDLVTLVLHVPELLCHVDPPDGQLLPLGLEDVPLLVGLAPEGVEVRVDLRLIVVY